MLDTWLAWLIREARYGQLALRWETHIGSIVRTKQKTSPNSLAANGRKVRPRAVSPFGAELKKWQYGPEPAVC